MPIYLAKYNPLCRTVNESKPAHPSNVPPFVDGSCRREPDLESACPSISALCRCGLFAPNLQRGDIVVYSSFKGMHAGSPHWGPSKSIGFNHECHETDGRR